MDATSHYARAVAEVLAGNNDWAVPLAKNLATRFFMAGVLGEGIRSASELRAQGTVLSVYEAADRDGVVLFANGRQVVFQRKLGTAEICVVRAGFPISSVPAQVRVYILPPPADVEDALELAREHVTLHIKLLFAGI